MEEFGRLFAGSPHAGFFSHGEPEFYIAIANITAIMFVFA